MISARWAHLAPVLPLCSTCTVLGRQLCHCRTMAEHCACPAPCLAHDPFKVGPWPPPTRADDVAAGRFIHPGPPHITINPQVRPLE